MAPAAPAAPSVLDKSSERELTMDEREIVDAYRKAKRLRHSDISISIQEGQRVKLWITKK